MKRGFLIMICLFMTILLPNTISYAANDSNHEARMKMYKDYELASGIPWYQIAAIDQYERNIYKFREESQQLKYETISICIPNERWSGPENPYYYDNDSYTINLFGGIGKDGDGDKRADINNEEDVMYTIVDYLKTYDNFELAVESYYQKEEAIRIIHEIAMLFEKYDTI